MANPPDNKALKADLTRRMDGAMETLKKEFSGLRTGRAAPALLESIRVEAYGANQALNQLANVSVGGPSMLVVQVFDRSVTKAVEVAIRDSGLNLNPQAEGQTIRIAAWKKKSEISEDDAKRWSDEVQKLTDGYVKQIDTVTAAKEKDIKTV